MALYLAFDAGGTKTSAILADEERILARAEGGSIKTLRMPAAEARANLEVILLQLATASGANLRHVRRTCVGTSGISAPAVRSWIERAIAQSVGGELTLLGDEVIALDSAFPSTRGVLVIAGTGSNIVARASTGQMVHAGGWGPMLGDQGSGYWIGHEALRACFRAIDAAPASTADHVAGGSSATRYAAPGIPAAISPQGGKTDLPPLLRCFMDHLKLPDLEALIGSANALEFRFAQLVPVVVQAALDGDSVAEATLAAAGEALAKLVLQAIAKIEGLEARSRTTEGGRTASAAELVPPTPEVAYIGSVLTHIPKVRSAMRGAMARIYPRIVLHPEPVDALAGALWHARGCPA
ncbi:MAG TPA: BadF/BadG/BcrA/BcrD ATPase family protein [Acidobacteriaceae bacterium]